MQDTATLPQPASVERPEAEISFPAIILCDEETAALKVAGLPILDRLLVAAHRAGAAQISVVSSKPLPLVPRTTALGISFRLVADMPNIEQPTLVLSAGARRPRRWQQTLPDQRAVRRDTPPACDMDAKLRQITSAERERRR